MSVSPKVSSATVGAAITTMVVGILGPHAFPHGMPADVQGLIAAVATAAITFSAGWFTRDAAKIESKAKAVEAKVEPEVKAVEAVYTEVKQSAGPVAQAVAQPLTPIQPR